MAPDLLLHGLSDESSHGGTAFCRNQAQALQQLVRQGYSGAFHIIKIAIVTHRVNLAWCPEASSRIMDILSVVASESPREAIW